MRLFIAEKPSVAKAIAGELGALERGDGFFRCGTDVVTWCFGHMLEQAEPDEYTPDDVPRGSNGKKLWRVEELPIIPKEWILKPKSEAKKQLAVIGRLLREAAEVVNAGDPDREGQLLVDEVLEHFKNSRAVKRFWVSAQDPVSIRRGLDGLKDNTAYAGWADAARGRQRADWLIGMNLSRAYTLRVQRSGVRALLPVGRVQSPTLALVVTRDRVIEGFKPVPYFTIRASMTHAEGAFVALWEPKEDQGGLDEEGRLVDAATASELVQRMTGKDGHVADYTSSQKQLAQPLSFALSDITLLASNKYGYSAEEVLNACQSLYETHKLVSYPRTDCAYLPESQHADSAKCLAALRTVNPELRDLIDRADPNLKSKTWNDAKVSAHHGIIPTLHAGSKAGLNEQEARIYDLIVRGYLAQFYPPHEYLSTRIDCLVEGERLVAKGRIVTVNGWRDVFEAPGGSGSQKSEESAQALPQMRHDDAVSCVEAVKTDAKTKPPSRFTEGTLIRAMENVHQFVESPEHKKVLREGDGIGTSATRASIIGELKTREFLKTQGKYIVSTTVGRSVIDALPEALRSPVLTALYERVLKAVEGKTASLEDFVSKQEDFIRTHVAKANVGSFALAGAAPGHVVSQKHKCATCGLGLARRASSKKKAGFWWGCSGYPSCGQTYPDVKGRPDYSRGKAGNQPTQGAAP